MATQYDKKEIELKDTIAPMTSEDYKERFIAEYVQLVIRYTKLKRTMLKFENGDLDFSPVCNHGLLNFQLRVMADYIAILESRAQIEGIDLPEVD
ncbi:MAG: crAss001_48 related protein [Candidatus Weimeria sp.]